MHKNVLTAATLAALVTAGTSSASVIITGILDGDESGGEPKAIELYVSGTEDLSSFTLERAANGPNFTSDISLSGVFTNSFVYLLGTGDTPEFEAAFGTSGDFANKSESSLISGNGNDAFRLVQGSTVIDQIATGGPSEYADGFLYRLDGTGPDGTFISANFTSGSVDGEAIGDYSSIVPFGTYVVPEPIAAGAAGLLGLVGLRRRRA